ncbi:hypothetical protein AAE478_007194 [Parahypoxylon ruwenzoriense]
MALIRRLGFNQRERIRSGTEVILPPDVATAAQRSIERMPDRRIIDFLVQYYVAEVNWLVSLWA